MVEIVEEEDLAWMSSGTLRVNSGVRENVLFMIRTATGLGLSLYATALGT